MPTPEAVENVRRAEERMKAANEEHLAFLERSKGQYSRDVWTENRRLLDNVNRTMAEYWEAFDRAAKS